MLDQINVEIVPWINVTPFHDPDPGCPRQFDCDNDHNLTSFDIGTVPTYASIVSSSLSCIGSLLILLAYWMLKEMRNVAQKIITLLAFADLITASGYLLAAGNFLSHFNQTDPKVCVVFQTVCKIQSFVTTWSTLCSFGWTVALALHFYLILRLLKQELLTKMLVIENVLIWLLPLLIVIPMLATERLGYTRYATSNWCYITDTQYPSSDLQSNGVTIALMLIAGNLWEMLSYVAVVVLYGLTRRQYKNKIKERNSERRSSGTVKNNPSRVEQRLLLIPIMFILLRMWGTTQFFFSISTSAYNNSGCIPSWMWTIYYILGILQAIGDGGQGWGNAFLYVFLSSAIRRELLFSPCVRLVECTGKRLRRIGEKLETVRSWNDTSVANISQREIPVDAENETNPLLRRKRTINYRTASRGSNTESAAPSMIEQAAPGPYTESRA